MSIKNLVLVGQPNSGKSTLFNVLADIKSPNSGATFDYLVTELDVYGQHCKLVDLPGTYSLNPVEPAEKITYDYLVNQEIDLIINVIDATLITRALELTIELIELGKPMLIVLNMMDLAERHGVVINADELSRLTGVPVIKSTALYGKGGSDIIAGIYKQFSKPSVNIDLNYTFHIEEHIKILEAKFSSSVFAQKLSPKFLAVKAIENPDLLPLGAMELIKDIKSEIDKDLFEHHKKENFETIALERHHFAMDISEKVSRFESKNKRYLGDKFDTLLMHPILGYGFLLLFFGLYFFSIFFIGSFFSGLMETPLELLETLITPVKSYNDFLWHTLNGVYLGITGIMGIVLPYFLPLVFLTSVFEETGYLSRIAFLIDGLFHKIGLHGKSVAPFVLGFGCSVPAIYATRLIENPRDRKVTGVLIPFIPCSARIAVIFALTAGFTGNSGVIWSFIVFAWVLLIIAISGKILSKLYTKPMGLVLEIQNLRIPSLKISLKKTYFKINDFVKEAFLFLIIGSVLLSWIEYFDLAKYINHILEPFITGVLSLPEELSSTLVFGFFRKELIIVMMNQALGIPAFAELPLSPQQIIVFIIFVTLYFPCFTTFVVIIKEFGAKVSIYSAVFSVIIAAISAYIFKLIFVLFL